MVRSFRLSGCASGNTIAFPFNCTLTAGGVRGTRPNATSASSPSGSQTPSVSMADTSSIARYAANSAISASRVVPHSSAASPTESVP